MYTDKFATKPGELKWSVEILPLELGKTVKDLKPLVEPFLEYKPIGIDVTYHQEEMVYTKGPNGTEIGHPETLKPGTITVCAVLSGWYKEKYGVDIIPHLTCGGFTGKECEEALIECYTGGLDTILVLRGDPPKGKKRFIPQKDKEGNIIGHHYASQFVEQVANLRGGIYYYSKKEDKPLIFCIGVAGYPDKHRRAPNMAYDLEMLKNKVDKGAHYIVTQMVFDTKKYVSFVEAARRIGVTVPIIPGLKPITRKNQLFDIPDDFSVEMPHELVKEVLAHDDKDVPAIGLEWCVQQCKELLQWQGDPLGRPVPALHFYSMNRGDEILDVLKRLM